MEDNSSIGNSIAKLFKVVQNRIKFSAKIFREIHVHYYRVDGVLFESQEVVKKQRCSI